MQGSTGYRTVACRAQKPSSPPHIHASLLSSQPASAFVPYDPGEEIRVGKDPAG